MRKTLLATSALALAGALAVGSASAADKMSAGVSGYMQQWFGMADQDAASPNSGGFAQQSDSEFFITGSLKADNGLTFGVKIEVEGNGSGGIDESVATVSGDFGKVNIGAEDNAQTLTHVGVGDVGVGLNCGDVGAWIVGVNGCGEGLETTGHQHGDRRSVTYFTPRMSGVQLAVSYIPDIAVEASNVAPKNNDNDGWAVGLNATQSLGDASVNISLGHRSASGSMDPVNLMSGADSATRLMRGEVTAADKAIAAYKKARDLMVAKKGGDVDASGLSVLQTAAANATNALADASDIMGAHKADANNFTNFGLTVGMGAFTFGVAAATRDGGAYMVDKNDMVVIDPTNRWDHDGDGCDAAADCVDDPAKAGDQSGTAGRLEADGLNDPDNDWARTELVENSSKDYDVVSVGTTYTDGPMAASLSYMMVDYGDGGESEATMLSFSYTLAPGVASKTSIFAADQQRPGKDDTSGEGTAFVTGITISF